MKFNPLFIAAAIGLMAGVSASAEIATIVYPDGPQDCQFEALQVSPSNLTLAVSGCYRSPQPPSPPPSPPPSVSGDPGSGVWVSPGGTVVFDPSPTSNRTFLPGCIDGRDWKTSNCEYEGGLAAGGTYAARVRLGRNTAKTFKFDLAEAGEASSEVRGALSSIPGDLQSQAPNCLFGGAKQRIVVADAEYADAGGSINIPVVPGLPPIPGAAPEPMCVVPADTLLYLSFTPSDPGCGQSLLCRALLIRN